MEEKERFEVMSPSLNGYAYIHDFETDNVLNTYDSCDLLNQQDKENQQLKQQLHDLPKKIVEEIKNLSIFDFKAFEAFGLRRYTINELTLETILKKYGGENE